MSLPAFPDGKMPGLEGGAKKARKPAQNAAAWKSTGRKVIVSGVQKTLWVSSAGKYATKKMVPAKKGKPASCRYVAHR
jgi:hypothetical protein